MFASCHELSKVSNQTRDLAQGPAKLRDSIRIRIGHPIRFERDWPIRKFSNRIGRACPLLVVSLVKRLKPLTALSDTVYRHASSMSDHTPVV